MSKSKFLSTFLSTFLSISHKSYYFEHFFEYFFEQISVEYFFEHFFEYFFELIFEAQMLMKPTSFNRTKFFRCGTTLHMVQSFFVPPAPEAVIMGNNHLLDYVISRSIVTGAAARH